MAASANKARGEEVNSAAVKGDNSGKDKDDDVQRVQFSGKKTKNSEMITLEIDLTDPADLMKKLEMVDLTEEESDALFQQALQVNKLLKAELKRQKQSQAPSGHPGLGPRQSTQLQLSAPASAASRSSAKSTKSGVSINQGKPLPPIRGPSGKSQASSAGGARRSSQGSSQGKNRASANSGKYSYISSPQGLYGPKPPGSSSSSSKSSTPASSASKSRREQVTWQKTRKEWVD